MAPAPTKSCGSGRSGSPALGFESDFFDLVSRVRMQRRN